MCDKQQYPFIIDFASQLLVDYYWPLVYVQLLLEYYETTKGSEAWYSGPDLDGVGYLVCKGDKKKKYNTGSFP